VHQFVGVKVLLESVGLENYTTMSKNVEKAWRGPIEKSYFIHLLDTPLPQWVTKRRYGGTRRSEVDLKTYNSHYWWTSIANFLLSQDLHYLA
jgi:hypothetical protein